MATAISDKSSQGMAANAAIAPDAPQYMQALGRANQIRLGRASVKRAIGKGELDIITIIDGTADAAVLECTETITLSELLRSQRRWGHTRARKLLSPLNLKEHKELGKLTTRQRNQLVAELKARKSDAVSDSEPAQSPQPAPALA